jgi:PTH1 family peptidyl-tRNA hydrolase
MYIIVGLGNPGEEYENTRHNIGRMFAESFAKAHELPEFSFDKKTNALVSKGVVAGEKVTLVLPETFMNRSGAAVAPLVKSKKAAESLVVIHDELDMPLGRIKMSFNKSSGGHRGVESIRKVVGTDGFVRVRVGISAETGSGKNKKLKKPSGEEAVQKHILGKFKPAELTELKKEMKRVNEALEILLKDGRPMAMNVANTK